MDQNGPKKIEIKHTNVAKLKDKICLDYMHGGIPFYIKPLNGIRTHKSINHLEISTNVSSLEDEHQIV